MKRKNRPCFAILKRAVALALAVAAIVFAPMPRAEAAGTRRVVGYLPTWSYQAYQTLDFSALTHINIAFCNPDASGNMSHGLPSDSILHEIVTKAHQNGVYVLASLGGAGGSDHYEQLTGARTRDAFNEKLMAFVDKFNLDGIDVDVEGEAPARFWNQFEGWALSLRALCDQKGLILTTAISTWYSDKITDKALAAFDFYNIMAYDGHHSDHSPYWLAQNMLAHYEHDRGLPADELVLGVPFYGYSSGKYTAYKTVLATYPNAWSIDFVGAVAHNGIPTINQKCELAKRYGGIMIWELSMDVAGEHSLLRAIKLSMNANASTGPNLFDSADASGNACEVPCDGIYLVGQLGARPVTID